jgi:hypothetical protein
MITCRIIERLTPDPRELPGLLAFPTRILQKAENKVDQCMLPTNPTNGAKLQETYAKQNSEPIPYTTVHATSQSADGSPSYNQVAFFPRFPFFLGSPFRLRSSRSPSANHRLALTSWTTLMNCFPAMTGNEMPAMTQGQKLSILLARASSRAPAEYGLGKSFVRMAALVAELADGRDSSRGCRRAGLRVGEEKERR